MCPPFWLEQQEEKEWASQEGEHYPYRKFIRPEEGPCNKVTAQGDGRPSQGGNEEEEARVLPDKRPNHMGHHQPDKTDESAHADYTSTENRRKHQGKEAGPSHFKAQGEGHLIT